MSGLKGMSYALGEFLDQICLTVLCQFKPPQVLLLKDILPVYNLTFQKNEF